MPSPSPLHRFAPCEAARPERHHRGADGGRRTVQERSCHHRTASGPGPLPAARTAVPGKPGAPRPLHAQTLWRDMMERWLPDRE